MIVDVARQSDHVTVTWDDGAREDYHYVWLRDNCACPECRHPQAWERLFDVAQMPPDLAPDEVRGDEMLRIRWPDDHETLFSSQWLRKNAYGAAARGSRAPAPVLWDASIAQAPPEISLEEIDSGDAGLLAWLRLIRDYGFAVVRDVPTEIGAVEALAERIAFVQESNFGRSFHVISKPDPENLAYTPHKLNAHTDVVNRHSAVNLQLLHCLEFEAEGGESILVDGFEAARRLREEDPGAYRLLSAVEVPFRFQDESVDITNHSRILNHDGDGRLVEIRINTALMAPLDIDSEQMVDFYAALGSFVRILRRPELEYAFKMRPGDCQVFDNQRVLHARAAFDPNSGPRHLQGCYVDKDDFRGRLAALERNGADFRRW